jgi:threonine synthase
MSAARPASHVTHLEAAIDGTVLPARTLQTVHAGRPLWVRYDLPAIAAAWDADRWRAALRQRQPSLWRYRELLPVEREQSLVSLGETMTPLVECPRLAAACGVARLLVKDESRLPTGSFKARGMALAVSMAKELGVTRVALPTAGNAGGALAAYAARAGMEAFVFMPADTPAVNRCEAALFGAHAFTVNGLITDCGAIVREGAARCGWFDMSTLREPYRIEGKKTMGLELAEQMDWRLPGAILYPTGGGTGLIGMWKAFGELAELGFLADVALPRLFSCQSSGCAPIAAAFDAGERFGIEPEAPHTVASGLRVPRALGDFMILDAVRASGGRAMSADESCITGWMRRAMELEGLSLCPESAVCLGVLERALAAGHVRRDETVVLFNTGAVQKYVEVMEAATGPLPTLDRHAVDWEAIAACPAVGSSR